MKERTAFFSALIRIVLLVLLCRPAVTHGQEPLVLSIYPYFASTEIYKRFSPLADHLSKELGRPITIHVANTYDAHVNEVVKGTVDIAFMGPVSYVKLTKRSGRVPILAAFETQEGRTYRGVIFVNKNSPIRTLAQVRGKTFAFGDVNSTMSHLVPRFMLMKAGIGVKDLSRYEFLTNHENTALGVLSGNFDAGALKKDVYNQYASQGLRVLATSEPMPDHVFIARPGLPNETVRRISAILCSLNRSEEGRRILISIQNNLTSLVPAQNADYDPLRKVMDALTEAEVNP